MSLPSMLLTTNNISPELNKINFSSEQYKESFSLNFKSIRFHIENNIYLYFSEDKSSISLSPIIPSNRSDILFKLYKLDSYKEKIENKLKALLGEKNIIKSKSKKYKKNNVEIEKLGKDIKIIDSHFIEDCIILSRSNTNDCAYNICNKISDCLFNVKISFQYIDNRKENPKLVYAVMKSGEINEIDSDPCKDKKEAQLNVLKKFINKYLPEKYSEIIIGNIIESMKNAEKNKSAKKNRYEKLLESFGGDRKLLRKKRKLNYEEFSKRLPYFNMLDKDKMNNNNNYQEDQNDDEFIFINTESEPVDKILLGDSNIVDNHLQDFTYTPFKLFEMIRDSENTRGVDFKIEYGQNNDTDFCHTNEATIFSQKLGIKVQGYGRSKEEAENKCALYCLAVIFKSKFKTFYQLHNYFKKKNGKYLDILVEDKRENENEEEKKENFKKKKISESLEIINLTNEEKNIKENCNNDTEIISIIEDENDNENENGNFIDEGISEININKSFQNENKTSSSITSNQIINALSSNNSNENNNNQENSGEDSISMENNKINDEEEIEDLFFIQNK